MALSGRLRHVPLGSGIGPGHDVYDDVVSSKVSTRGMQ